MTPAPKRPATIGNRFLLLSVLFAIGATLLWQHVGAEPQDRAPINDATHLETTVIAEGFEFPWSLAFLPDGGFLVTEREGRLQHLSADGKTRREITGLPAIYVAGQAGLFDITLAPDFAQSGLVYFAFAAGSAEENNTELARAQLDIENAQLKDVQIIFRAQPKTKGRAHYGGRILFMPDGTLLLTLGDRFAYRDNAQNTTDHLGTVVRLMPDGSIPADNPFKDGPAPAVYTHGNRNVQGIALHPDSGAIWAHEHGPRGGDEINILISGANYGWPVVTHGREYSGLAITDKRHMKGMEDPLLHWTPSIAPSGMAFYTGDKMPQWRGDLFVGALAGRHLRRLDIEGGRIIRQEKLLTTLEARIRDVRNGPDGYIYILTDALDGQLLRYGPKR
ncbi:MAG: PQQ-dependent sugar dehydrogenase [Alphaproteobacteria bacterium]